MHSKDEVSGTLLHRLMPLAYGLVAVIGLILALTWGALQVQVTLAGFLNGESVWSKAQKQAVIDLDVYAASGDAAALESFRKNYAILLADRSAREQVASGQYEYTEAAEALRTGSIIPEAIPGAIFILEHLTNAPHMMQAMTAWRSVDEEIAELAVVAKRLEHAYANDSVDAKGIATARARIHALNRAIEPQSNIFSREVARGAWWAGHILFMAVFAAACLATLLWLLMARRVLISIRGTEQRYQLLFDSAGDGIVMVDDQSGQVMAANRRASAWIGRKQQELVGSRFADVFVHAESTAGGDSAIGTLRDDCGAQRWVEMQSSVATFGQQRVRQAILRDITERLAMEQDRRIASEALASVAEGVIIADENRRVTSVNAAHYRMTGFTSHMMQDMRIDDIRVLPNGESLPQSVWDSIENGNNWLGEVLARRSDDSSYSEMLSISAIRDRSGRVQRYVAIITDITEPKANQVRLEHLATHDALTGLANRIEFERCCAQAIAAAAHDRMATAVLFIDIDAFKVVNDSYSHAIGDGFLVTIAQRINRELGKDGVAGRIGGDEFTVVVGRLHSREDVVGIVNRLLLELSRPITVGDHEIALSASIGIAGYPEDGADAATLIANADAAMYAAKTEERNTFRFYAPSMRADERDRLELGVDLRHALDHNEFTLVYQPGIEIRTGRMVSAEALLRWNHPRRGEVCPERFIAMAEGVGLIRRIDKWVLRAACEQIQHWTNAGLPPLKVAINISAASFSHPGFVTEVSQALQRHAVPPTRLMLEITERIMLRLGDGIQSTLRGLHELGVDVAIDDFGTGYSSLAYLKLPAVTCLKIDQSFVSGLPNNMNDVAIVEAIMALSESLNLRTIAEGIETEAQHECLLRMECNEAQGFLYARPLDPAAIERMLRPNPVHPVTKLRIVPNNRTV